MEERIRPGLYRHYKGNFYRVIGVARHSETREEVVVYLCLYDDCSLWVRPLSMFVETVTVEGRDVSRFEWYGGNKAMIEVDRERCKGCGRCVSACGGRLISLETFEGKKIAVIGRPQQCDLCGRCIAECPFGVISPRAVPSESR
ncbi:4Fe-4S ferredoxin [Geobacteraceae bacterium]|nr:4Fe-4S ferredoxin [Geobacteraceae bacterium]